MAEDRLRLDRLSRNAVDATFVPWSSPIPRDSRKKRSEEGRDYLSLKLDDPSFNTPICANLFDDEGGKYYTLLWSWARKDGE
ncbi:DUF736 family protein [Bradyrhizobium japonicum]|nr:DUF736 family protein [Bradyrhizobium japonicum]